jgi:hypothetical protein
MSEGREQIEREIAEGNMVADQLQTLMKENGLELEDIKSTSLRKVVKALRMGGKAQAIVYIWNDSDKFRGEKFHRDIVIPFIEEYVFDAGPDRISKETPWNYEARRKAKLK